MKILSLKLKEDIFDEVENLIKEIHMSRNAYLNEAVEFYNKLNKRKSLRNKLAQESKAVSATSLEVLRELEKLEDDLL